MLPIFPIPFRWSSWCIWCQYVPICANTVCSRFPVFDDWKQHQARKLALSNRTSTAMISYVDEYPADKITNKRVPGDHGTCHLSIKKNKTPPNKGTSSSEAEANLKVIRSWYQETLSQKGMLHDLHIKLTSNNHVQSCSCLFHEYDEAI